MADAPTARANFRERAYSLWKDIGERAAWTFVQTFIAVEGFDTFLGELIAGRLNLNWFNTAKIAAAASVASVIKGFVASRMPVSRGALVSTAALPEPVTTRPVADTATPGKVYGGEAGQAGNTYLLVIAICVVIALLFDWGLLNRLMAGN